MDHIREFIRTGGGLTESKLSMMVREQMMTAPAPERRNWLRQVELSLDGYGLQSQISAAQRVMAVIKELDAELDS